MEQVIGSIRHYFMNRFNVSAEIANAMINRLGHEGLGQLVDAVNAKDGNIAGALTDLGLVDVLNEQKNFAIEDYQRRMMEENQGVGEGFGGGQGMGFPEADMWGRIGEGAFGANQNALGQILGNNPGLANALMGPGWSPASVFQNAWDGYNSYVEGVGQRIGQDMYANRRQRNWSKMMQANDDFRWAQLNAWKDVMGQMMGVKNTLAESLPGAISGAFGALGRNMYNPSGPQAVEDVDGTALISTAVQPGRAEVQESIDPAGFKGALGDMMARKQTEYGSKAHKAKDAASQQYAKGLGLRSKGTAGALASDQTKRKQDSVNQAAANRRATDTAINNARAQANMANIAMKYNVNNMNTLGGMLGDIFSQRKTCQ